MEFFKAIIKFFARKFENFLTNREKKKAQPIISKRSKQRIRKQKRMGRKVNAKKIYQDERRKEFRKINQRSKNRLNFINDL